MIEDAAFRTKERSHRGNFWWLNSVKGTYTKHSTGSDENPGSVRDGESSSSRPASDATGTPKGNDQDTRDGSGVRQRKQQLGKQKARDEFKGKRDKWIIIGLPSKKYKTLEHIEVDECGQDLDVFRKMRALYKRHSNSWRHWLELHDVHHIHLVKVRT